MNEEEEEQEKLIYYGIACVFYTMIGHILMGSRFYLFNFFLNRV